jgi:hypothetical protein
MLCSNLAMSALISSDPLDMLADRINVNVWVFVDGYC